MILNKITKLEDNQILFVNQQKINSAENSNQQQQQQQLTMADDNYVSTEVPDPADNRLSEIGQMYDINGDGVLDETERASKS